MKSFFKKPLFILAIAACITGFFIMLSIRSYAPMFSKSDDGKQQSIIEYIQKLEDETASLEEQITTAREKIENMQQKETEDNETLLLMQTQIDQLNQKAGYTELTGSGVTLAISDNDKGAAIAQKNNSAYNPEDFIVHDKNLLYMVHDLANVAQAIAINDQRIVDTSNIRCVGTVIMVNTSRMAPPYDIKILGDPDKLKEAILNAREYKSLLAKDMPMKITTQENLTIPAYSGSNTTTYAK